MAEEGQPGTRPVARDRRARDRHPQDLEGLTKLRSSPHRATVVVQAILVPHHVENPLYTG
jgi:hypothetical protein